MYDTWKIFNFVPKLYQNQTQFVFGHELYTGRERRQIGLWSPSLKYSGHGEPMKYLFAPCHLKAHAKWPPSSISESE